MSPDSAASLQQPWTTRRLLEWMGSHFESRDIDAHDVMAQMLLAHVLSVEPIELFTDPERPATQAELDQLRLLVQRATRDEPVQYLVGAARFLGRNFQVTPSVLIPRSASEAIIQCVMDRQRGGADIPPMLQVADIGTGSGCLGITLALHLPEACVLATDISQDALDVATRNARQHGVAERIEFMSGVSCQPLHDRMPTGGFDLVVTNPPYISDPVWSTLDASVRDFEPVTALRGGEHGLNVIHEILGSIGPVLAEDGLLVLEFGDDQASAVLQAAHDAGLGPARIGRDVHGDDRILIVDRLTP